MSKKQIHIVGASGCGVSTLGRAIAHNYGWTHIDVDDYYWQWDGVVTAYTEKRPIPERIRLIREQMTKRRGWVVSGSLCSWGGSLVPFFELVIFLAVPTEIRLERLRKREREQFGTEIDEGGSMHENHQKFIDWANQYDTGGLDIRSRKLHEHWLSQLKCPVLRIEGTVSLEHSLAQACIAIDFG